LIIGIVTVSFPTLSETFISNKVAQLAQHGHKVIVFCDSVNTGLFNSLFQASENVKVLAFTKSAIAKYAALHPWALLKGGKAARKAVGDKAKLHYISGYKPDIIHVEFSGLGTLLLPILQNLTVKKVVSCRGSAEKVKLLVFEDRKTSIKTLFNHVDAIHCVSEDMKQTILPYCNEPSKIFINYPSIDEKKFSPANAIHQNKPLQILSVGRLTFQKGYLTGLLAIKKLSGHYSDFRWIIAGDGAQREEIIFHIHQLGLQNNVSLIGPKKSEEVLSLYSQVDIFFLPSVYEGVANVVLEAMSMQLPVVATKSGGMQEVITHGINGLLADVYDAELLAEHLLTLAKDEEKRKSLGINARQRILEQFTLEKQVTIFENVYKKLLTA
jgi:colanic acid/amylovoran biosynthesis glycosyltransferase